MAQEHNALKYFPALSRLGERGFGIDDNEQSITRMSETLQGVADLWRRPEWALYRGETLWSGLFSQGAVVGETGFVGVQNPTGSGVLVALTGIIIVPAANSSMDEVIISNFVPTSTGSPSPIDTRIPGYPNVGMSTVSFAHHQAAALGGTLYRRFAALTTQSIQYPSAVILKPGFSYYVAYTSLAANTAISATLFGWERRAFPGELAN